MTVYALEGPVIKSRWVRDFSSLGPTQPCLTMGAGLFPGGLALTTYYCLLPKLKSIAILLLPFWNFLACSGVKFAFLYLLVARIKRLRTAGRAVSIFKLQEYSFTYKIKATCSSDLILKCTRYLHRLENIYRTSEYWQS